ncbi:hypothetical protein FQA39_LY15451 [Lamprigera yunnana]|nr:hypothetical protein FQA39_LY15451 [Lamprigera yunnana]
MGTNYAKSGLKCTDFQAPIIGVSKADESLCLNSIDVCCNKEHREQECKLGQEDVESGKPCGTTESRKGCCEVCEIGIEAGRSKQPCQSQLGLGALMDAIYSKCCEKSVSKLNITKSNTIINSEITVAKGFTPITTFTKSLQKHNENISSPSTLEILCDLPDLCAHICIQMGESYRCKCYAGFTLMSDGISCKPNRQTAFSQRCAVNNPCDQKCTDTGVAIKCSCYEGYKLASDKKSCKDIDECLLDLHDCADNEVCMNLEGDYDCQEAELTSQKIDYNDKCPEGYKFNGQQMVCDDIDECEVALICPKPGTCMNTIGSYKCENTEELPKCPPGFYFKTSIQSCEDIDECVLGIKNCNKESQICLNTKGNYTCIDKASKKTCPPGFKKNMYTQQCEDIDECKESIHLCAENEECLNKLGGYTCTLKSPPLKQILSGQIPLTSTIKTITTLPTFQSTTITPYTTSSTVVKPVINSGHISHVSTTFKPMFPALVPSIQRMTCSVGYKLSVQSNICIDIDECKEINQICDSNQDCYNAVGSYVCSCKIGFTKDHQTGACVDVNECQIGRHDCSEAQRCDNTIGSYVCARTTGCGTGYTLNSATGLCEDDDECLLGLHNCRDLGPKFQCRNTLGSYRCERIKCVGDCFSKKISTTTNPITTQNNPIISGQLKKCLSGYIMNQKGECEDIDECESNPCKRGEKCLNLNGKYQCIPLIYCKSGYELNEAGTACEDINECARGTHKCKNSQICKNGPGYYICQCPPGHKLNADNECEDINECDFYRERICSHNAQCINVIGSYECKCKEGFRTNGHICEDIDECAEVSGLCHQNCVNLWGSYRCSCNRGFTLSIDNRTCTDINECEKFKDKYLCVGTCQNTPGSYSCRCPEGYRLGSDGRTCQDIDECQHNICRNVDDICINTRGSYKCHTITCPPNYIKDPEHKSRCKRASNVCDIRDTHCIRMPGQYSYHFITFVSNLPIPDEGKIDFFQMKGPSWVSSSANFNMDIVNVRCPLHIKQADSSYFRMKRDFHKVIVSLVSPIEGPQEIELQLQMELYECLQHKKFAEHCAISYINGGTLLDILQSDMYSGATSDYTKSFAVEARRKVKKVSKKKKLSNTEEDNNYGAILDNAIPDKNEYELALLLMNICIRKKNCLVPRIDSFELKKMWQLGTTQMTLQNSFLKKQLSERPPANEHEIEDMTIEEEKEDESLFNRSNSNTLNIDKTEDHEIVVDLNNPKSWSIDKNLIKMYVEHGPIHGDDLDIYPSTNNRRFNKQWFTKTMTNGERAITNWLIYCKTLDTVVYKVRVGNVAVRH